MTPTTRGLGISTVAALALGLAVLPAEAQTVAPVLPFATSDADWAQYLSTPTSADQTTATADKESGQAWKRVGIGAAALGAGGLFSFYVAGAHSSPRSAAQSAAPPAAPKSTEPGPVASQPGPAAGSEGASPLSTSSAGSASSTTPQAGSDGASTSTSQTWSSGASASTDGAAPPSTPDEGSGGTIEDTGTGSAGWESAPGASTMIDDGFTTSGTAPTFAAAPTFEAAAAATTVTPEPATLVLLMSGLLGVLFLSRRRRTA